MNQYYFLEHISILYLYIAGPKDRIFFPGIYIRIRKSVGPPALLLTIVTFNKRTFLAFQLIFQKITQQLNLSLLTQLKSRISRSSKRSCRAFWQLPLHVLLHSMYYLIHLSLTDTVSASHKSRIDRNVVLAVISFSACTWCKTWLFPSLSHCLTSG